MLSKIISRLRSGFKAFDIGGHGRRLAAVPSTTVAINTLIRTYGASVVARSRYLASQNPYAVSAKETFVAAMVGDGIKPSSKVTDKVKRERLMELWLDSTDEMDADGNTDFYGLQALVAAELFEAGEVFARVRRRRPADGLLVPVQVQLLPSEMLPLNHNAVAPGGNIIEMGIEYDWIGRRVAYHFLRQHPGDQTMARLHASHTVRVPADEVIHVFRPIRVGQTRGIPHTLSALITLAMLDLYDDAELERKRMAALFGVFVTRPTGDEEESHPFGVRQTAPQPGEPDQFSLTPGMVVDLEPGEDVTQMQPADVGQQYEAFQYRMIMKAAAGFGVPYASMSGDLRRANYGSIRAGLVEFKRRVQALQHHVMIYQFCRRVWNIWCDEAAIAGMLPWTLAEYQADTLGIRRAKWIAPRWEWVDPLKDAQGEKVMVDNGFKSRDDVIEEVTGEDPEDVDERIAASQERRDAMGIRLAEASAAPAEPDEGEDADEDADPDAEGAEDESDGDGERRTDEEETDDDQEE